MCFAGMSLGNAFAAGPIDLNNPPSGFELQSTESPAATPPAAGGDTSTGASQIGDITNNIEAALKSLTTDGSTSLAAYGLELLGLLFVLNFVWLILKGMATGRMLDAFIGDILPLGVGTVAAYMFINGADGQTINITTAVEQTMNAISTKLSPDFASRSLGGLIGDTVGKTLTIIVNVMDMNTAKASMGIKDILGGAFTVVLFGFLLKWFAVIGSAIFLLIAMGIFIGTLVITQITLTIAMIFMPIFVPFLIFKPLSGLFNTWLQFFVTAWFTKIIGLLILTITSLIMTSMVKTSEALRATEMSPADALSFNMVQYSSLILLSALCALMMLKVPGLASGLVGGMSSGFSGWGDLNRGTMSQGPMGGMKAGASNVGQGGKSVGSPQNMLSGVTSMAPNALKPITNAAGAGLSNWQGGGAAKKDIDSLKAQQAAFNGPMQPGKGSGGNLGRDISSMSPAAQNAYTAHAERANEMQGQSGGSNYTIAPHVSTTSSKHPSNAPISSGGSTAKSKSP